MQKTIFAVAVTFGCCVLAFTTWETHRPQPDDYGTEASEVVSALLDQRRWTIVDAVTVGNGKLKVSVVGRVEVNGEHAWMFNKRERREIGRVAYGLHKQLQRDAIRDAIKPKEIKPAGGWG